MKTKNVSHITVCAAAVTIVSFTSCSRSQKRKCEVSNEIAIIPEASSDMDTGAPLRADGRPDIRKIDVQAYYKSVLKKYGVDDFTTNSLVRLMDSEIPSVRAFSALLLGHRQELSAIPRLEKALSDELLPVRRVVTTALLQMGNRKGIKVLEDFCEKAYREFEQGNHENTSYMLGAAVVLADAGEVSAIPYLQQLLGYNSSWGVRLKAVRALSQLYEKDASVLTHIASMQNDEHPQVRTEAAEILARLQSRK